AEKASMGRLIANTLSNDYNALLGYFQLKNGDIVTFASGHLLALKEPQDYDPTLSKWEFEKLPLIFYDVAFKSVPNNSQQLAVIQKLLSQPFDKIYHCGDSDQEGQIIVDELLMFFNHQLDNVYRVLITDNNKILESIQKAENNREKKFQELSNRGFLRAKMDQAVGINLTRALTLHKNQYGTVFHVGRVKNAMINLLANREQQILDHKKVEYFVPSIKFKDGNKELVVHYRNKKDDKEDPKLSLEEANEILRNLEQEKSLYLNKKEATEYFKEAMGYNLSALQKKASALLKISPQKVLDIVQELYMNGYVSYPRSECEYLNDTDFNPNLKDKLLNTYANEYEKAGIKDYEFDNTNKNSVFDSNKTQEHSHTAIIPTEKLPLLSNLDSLSTIIYKLIMVRYVSLYLKKSKVLKRTFFARQFENLFEKTFSKNLSKTYKDLENAFFNKNVADKPNEILDFACREYNSNEYECFNEKRETKPNPPFNTPSFFKELEKKKIGTPATRGIIFEELKKNGFIIEEKQRLILSTTPKAKETMQNTKNFKTINFGERLDEFNNLLKATNLERVLQEFEKSLKEDVSTLNAPIKKDFSQKIRKDLACPVCATTTMIQRETNGISFYGCSNYSGKTNCKGVLKEVANELKMVCLSCDGAPVMEKIQNEKGQAFFCKSCRRIIYKLSPKKQQEQQVALEKEKKELLEQIKNQQIKCPKCFLKADVQINTKEKTLFLCCKNYPKCKWSANYNPNIPQCPKCNGLMGKKKNAKTDEIFYGCLSYPRCKGILSLCNQKENKEQK
ncbi:DNA topoisomerase, partial [Helicobacter pylori]|uniref:DNA topoisomerase n=1 Tax=Helicobacter pylori TaxID=210 RepID=UPI0005358F1F